MKRIKILCAIVLSSFSLSAQLFTWMKGTNTAGQVGIYGTIGVASATNNPGCRHGAATWVDTQGNLWLFGGEGYSNNNTLCWLNDLWKYDVQTNEWTWMGGANTANQQGSYGTQGVTSTNNQPGAREFMVSWTDASGNFWMFGGDGYDANATWGKLGDLWQFNPSTLQWTWMKGFNTVNQNGVYGTLGFASPANLPGCRSSSGAWIDGNGNLWLFGGRGYPGGGLVTDFLNDLWKYNITTNQWTWTKGSNQISQPSVYGTLNMSSAANSPGGTEFPTCWFAAGELFMFGGRGYPGLGAASYLNTFWKYNISLNQWTWIGGNNATMATGDYGTLGVSSTTNIPGARMSAVAWKDNIGNIWIFGGEGNASTLGIGCLNDLFRYTPATGHWTWMKGSNTVNQQGTYGTITVTSPTNMPGGRYYNTHWPITNGVGWLIGGLGYATANLADNMEDLWKFNPSCNPESISVAPGSTLCSGNHFTLTAQYQGNNTLSWYNVPNGGSAIASGSQIVTPTLQAIAVNSVHVFYTEAAGCINYPRTQINVTVAPNPTVVLSFSAPICSGDVFNCWTSGTAVSYTWSTGSNASSISLTLAATTVFTVTGEGLNGCRSSRTFTPIVLPLPQISILGSPTVCSGNSAVLSATGAATYSWSTGLLANTITVSPVSNTVYHVTGEDVNTCKSTVFHTLTVLPLPLVSILSKSVICKGDATTLSGNGAASYSWSTGQTSNSISVSPQTSTTYSVVGTGSNSCANSASLNLLVSECIGLSSINASEPTALLLVFPNPGTGPISIKTGRIQNAQVSIYNMLGQIVFSTVTTAETIKTELSRGIYMCVLSQDQHILKTARVVIE